jgi:circadian clock protein KaiC
MDLAAHLKSDLLMLEHVDPQSCHRAVFGRVRNAVQAGEARVVVIDSLSGYLMQCPRSTSCSSSCTSF